MEKELPLQRHVCPDCGKIWVGRSNQAMFDLVCRYPCSCMMADERRLRELESKGEASYAPTQVKVLGVFKTPRRVDKI